ncbi:hypothetical protein [Fodinibius sediminis]|nr:hypothetical protein [Fodinibius sediminis]
MKRLRSYITRLMMTLLVGMGFGLYMIQPVQASRNSDAFARWLHLMAQASDAPGLQQELQDLRASTASLADILEQASQIVKDNNEEFNFPFAEQEASLQMYQLLLIEWNQFQTGNAMSGIPVQQTVKSSHIQHIDKAGAMEAVQGLSYSGPHAVPSPGISSFSQVPATASVEPMSDGIAIGAP